MNNQSVPRVVRAIAAHMFHLPLIILVALATQATISLLGAFWATIIMFIIMTIIDWTMLIFYPKYEVLMRTHVNTAFVTAMYWSLILIWTSTPPGFVIQQAIIVWYLLYVCECWRYKSE